MTRRAREVLVVLVLSALAGVRARSCPPISQLAPSARGGLCTALHLKLSHKAVGPTQQASQLESQSASPDSNRTASTEPHGALPGSLAPVEEVRKHARGPLTSPGTIRVRLQPTAPLRLAPLQARLAEALQEPSQEPRHTIDRTGARHPGPPEQGTQTGAELLPCTETHRAGADHNHTGDCRTAPLSPAGTRLLALAAPLPDSAVCRLHRAPSGTQAVTEPLFRAQTIPVQSARPWELPTTDLAAGSATSRSTGTGSQAASVHGSGFWALGAMSILHATLAVVLLLLLSQAEADTCHHEPLSSLDIWSRRRATERWCAYRIRCVAPVSQPLRRTVLRVRASRACRVPSTPVSRLRRRCAELLRAASQRLAYVPGLLLASCLLTYWLYCDVCVELQWMLGQEIRWTAHQRVQSSPQPAGSTTSAARKHAQMPLQQAARHSADLPGGGPGGKRAAEGEDNKRAKDLKKQRSHANAHVALRDCLASNGWLSPGQIEKLVTASQIAPHAQTRQRLGIYNEVCDWRLVLEYLQAGDLRSRDLEEDFRGSLAMLQTMLTPEHVEARWFLTLWRDHHFVNIACDTTQRVMTIIDPLNQQQYRAGMAAAFCRRLQACGLAGWEIVEPDLKLQYDSHNCGVWAVWLSEQWQQYHIARDHGGSETGLSYADFVEHQAVLLQQRRRPADTGAVLRRELCTFWEQHLQAHPGLLGMPELAESEAGSDYVLKHKSPAKDTASSRDTEQEPWQSPPAKQEASQPTDGEKSTPPDTPREDPALAAQAAQHKERIATRKRAQRVARQLEPKQPWERRSQPLTSPEQSPRGKLRPATLASADKLAPATGTQPLTVLTWNVMGLTSMEHELRTTLQRLQPDIVVLTETKLVAQRHSCGLVKAVFEDPEGGSLTGTAPRTSPLWTRAEDATRATAPVGVSWQCTSGGCR